METALPRPSGVSKSTARGTDGVGLARFSRISALVETAEVNLSKCVWLRPFLGRWPSMLVTRLGKELLQPLSWQSKQFQQSFARVATDIVHESARNGIRASGKRQKFNFGQRNIAKESTDLIQKALRMTVAPPPNEARTYRGYVDGESAAGCKYKSITRQCFQFFFPGKAWQLISII